MHRQTRTPLEPSPSHVAWLDSVRGLAALAVVASHYVKGYDLPCRGDTCDRLLSNTPLHIWWDGAAAVSLFFVLSGLVLSLRHFRHGGPAISRFNLSHYVLGRLCRIWLPYLVVLALSALLYQRYQTVSAILPATLPKSSGWLPYLWGRPAGWAEFFQDSFLLGMRLDMVYVPQAWTLSIELSLSLLVPFGAMLAARRSLWLVFATVSAMYLGASANLFHFMLGILIAKHHARIGLYLQAHAAVRRLALMGGIFLYTVEETLGDAAKEALEKTSAGNLIGWLTGLGSGLILLNAWTSERTQKMLSLSWFRYVGRVSYSLYLIHFAVLVNTTPWFLYWLSASPEWFVAAWWAGFFATAGLSLLIAGFFYRWVEVPCMALGRRI